MLVILAFGKWVHAKSLLSEHSKFGISLLHRCLCRSVLLLLSSVQLLIAESHPQALFWFKWRVGSRSYKLNLINGLSLDVLWLGFCFRMQVTLGAFSFRYVGLSWLYWLHQHYHEVIWLWQAALVKDPAVSVNRTVWNPDGTLLGVAFSKHIVHIYTYNGASDLRQHLEVWFYIFKW